MEHIIQILQVQNGRSGDGFDRKYLEENGYIQVADTLTELAEKIGISPEHLLQSVNSYHAWKKAKMRNLEEWHLDAG